jgi:hypothetical protein
VIQNLTNNGAVETWTSVPCDGHHLRPDCHLPGQ